MPELPEVQTHAERLEAWLCGAVLRHVSPLAFAALKTYAPPPDAAVGRTLESVTRRGKLLVLGFGEVSHVVHLMQGGRLRPDSGRAARPRGGLMRWRFDPAGEGSGEAAAGGRGSERALVLTEAGTERKAGVWVVAGDPLTQPPLDGLGLEADVVEPRELARLLGARPQRLHTFLRDQRRIAGLGRRLANEVCHRAGLSPFVTTTALGEAGAARVVEAIRAVVDEGLAFERSREEGEGAARGRNPRGDPGPEMSLSKQRPAAVHNRAGEACPACGDTVRAVSYRDYTVNYCPACQTGGKVLADNVYSRLGIEREAQPPRPRR
ncbi:MAG: DNA-formamidopyrimidine glycosylase family protein [Egibacteraceae bacterium]